MRKCIRDVLEAAEAVYTYFKMLQKCGIKKGKARNFANTRKSYWRTAHSPIMQ
ncbi:MAG: hypothetical protein RR182_09040 [Alistipes sp.]